MSWDRGAQQDRGPAPAISPARVERVIGSVLGRLDPRPAPAGWRVWLAGALSGLAPVSRFAMPMAAAAVLAVVVNRHLQMAESPAMADLLSVATSYGTGF